MFLISLRSPWSNKETYGQILLVCEDQKQRIPQFILIQHALQLLACFDNTVAIVAVNHEDNTLRILEVMPPQWSNFVLPTNIPYGKLDVFVLDGLDIEA